MCVLCLTPINGCSLRSQGSARQMGIHTGPECIRRLPLLLIPRCAQEESGYNFSEPLACRIVHQPLVPHLVNEVRRDIDRKSYQPDLPGLRKINAQLLGKNGDKIGVRQNWSQAYETRHAQSDLPANPVGSQCFFHHRMTQCRWSIPLRGTPIQTGWWSGFSRCADDRPATHRQTGPETTAARRTPSPGMYGIPPPSPLRPIPADKVSGRRC